MEGCLRIENFCFKHALAKESAMEIAVPCLELERGKIISIVGASGSGKTTLFKILSGIIKTPVAGEIRNMFPSICYLMHESSMMVWLSVKSNYFIECQLRNKPFRPEILLETLAKLGLGEEVFSRDVKKLSLGMRQRVELAKAFVMKPEFLLLDETFSGIDSKTKFHARIELIEQVRRNRIAVVATSHHIADTLAYSNRIYVIDNGKLSESISMSGDACDRARMSDSDLLQIQTNISVMKKIESLQ